MDKPAAQQHHNDTLTLNRTLVDGLKSKGDIRTRAIEAAFREMLRRVFVPEVPLEEAYSERGGCESF